MVYGVDLGSRCVKIAAEENGGFEFMGPFDTAGFYRAYIEPDAEGGMLRRDLLGLKNEAGMAATGYGKARLGRGAVMVPELEAIIEGVKALTGLSDALILDVGGQDSKALLMRKGQRSLRRLVGKVSREYVHGSGNRPGGDGKLLGESRGALIHLRHLRRDRVGGPHGRGPPVAGPGGGSEPYHPPPPSTSYLPVPGGCPGPYRRGGLQSGTTQAVGRDQVGRAGGTRPT
jgi:hypothetical protein